MEASSEASRLPVRSNTGDRIRKYLSEYGQIALLLVMPVVYGIQDISDDGNLSRLGNKHVRSGAIAQWRREFTPELAAAFLKRFPGVLQSLGYETSDAWVLQLQQPEARSTFSDLRDLAAHHWEGFAGLIRSPSKF